MELTLEYFPEESDKKETTGKEKQGSFNYLLITDGEIKYTVIRTFYAGQTSKPTLKFAKGERIGFIFHHEVGPNDISTVAIVHVHSDTPDQIHATFQDVAMIQMAGKLTPQDLRVDPTKRSKLDRFLLGRSATNEDINCFWNFELVEKQWVVG
jgi:hypothetical protein